VDSPTAKRTGFGAAALLLAASALLSRMLGYVREAVLAAQVGAGADVDAYRAAFQIPDLLNYFLAGGAFTVAFVPLYTRALERGPPHAHRLYATVLGTVTAAAVVVTVLLWWKAEALVGLLFPDFDPAIQQLTARLTRIVLPAQIFFVAGGIVRGALMAEGSFRAQAWAPVLYNGAIISAGLILGERFGVEAFAWGVLVGAFLGPFLLGFVESLGRIPVRVRVAPLDPEFRRYLWVALPLMLGLSLLVVDEWYERYLAALPFLSRLWSEGRRQELDALVLRALRAGVATSTFAAAALIAFARPVVTAVYERGRFLPEDTLAVAALLAVLTLAAPAWVAQQVAARAFYARVDTWRPMILSTLVAVALFPLYASLSERMGPSGIVWAGAVGITLSAGATLVMARWLHGAPALGSLLGTAVRSIAIAALAAVAARSLIADSPGLAGALVDLAVGGAVFGVVSLVGIRFAGDAAMRDALGTLWRRLRGG
jgi:putative peptidoglycan lipid II flippase